MSKIKEVKADNRNKIQRAITVLDRIGRGEKVSDDFILAAIQKLDEAGSLLKRKQLKIIRHKLFLLLPDKMRNQLNAKIE